MACQVVARTWAGRTPPASRQPACGVRSLAPHRRHARGPGRDPLALHRDPDRHPCRDQPEHQAQAAHGAGIKVQQAVAAAQVAQDEGQRDLCVHRHEHQAEQHAEGTARNRDDGTGDYGRPVSGAIPRDHRADAEADQDSQKRQLHLEQHRHQPPDHGSRYGDANRQAERGERALPTGRPGCSPANTPKQQMPSLSSSQLAGCQDKAHQAGFGRVRTADCRTLAEDKRSTLL